MGIIKTSKFSYFLLALGITLFTGYFSQESFAKKKSINPLEKKENPDQIFSKCAKDFGEYNNGVLSICSAKVIEKVSKEIDMKISSIKSDLNGREGLSNEIENLIENQALWEKYVQSQCQFERRSKGMTYGWYCPMEKYLERNKELDFVIGNRKYRNTQLSNQFIKQSSKGIDSLILLAKEKYGLGQYEEALSSANQAVLLDDSNQEAYFIRGLINIKRPDWVSALNDFRKILEINPTSIDAQTMLGYMESGSGNYKIAVDRFTESLKLEPNNSNLYAYRSNANYLLKDYQSSINDITKALEIENEEDKEGDIADFARKNLINPEVSYSVLYTTLCSAYRNLGDFPNAIEACEKGIELEPNISSSYYLSLARMKWDQGDISGTCSDYDKAISIGYKPITLKERTRDLLRKGICLFK